MNDLKDKVETACKIAREYGDSQAKREALVLELLLEIRDLLQAGQKVEEEEIKPKKKGK